MSGSRGQQYRERIRSSAILETGAKLRQGVLWSRLRLSQKVVDRVAQAPLVGILLLGNEWESDKYDGAALLEDGIVHLIVRGF